LPFWNSWKKSTLLTANKISHSGLARFNQKNMRSSQIWSSMLSPMLQEKLNTSKCLSTPTWSLMEENRKI
jgi:hypothetical protein